MDVPKVRLCPDQAYIHQAERTTREAGVAEVAHVPIGLQPRPDCTRVRRPACRASSPSAIVARSNAVTAAPCSCRNDTVESPSRPAPTKAIRCGPGEAGMAG